MPALALAFALLVGFAHLDVLRASELGNGISNLFERGAKNTPPAVAAAKSQYEKLKRSNAQDRRIDYAYGVVLVNQHKYRDALPLLSRYLETAKPELNAHRVKILAQVFLRPWHLAAIDECKLLVPHGARCRTIDLFRAQKPLIKEIVRASAKGWF